MICKTKEYYSEHLDEFIEEFCGIKLFQWQKTMIRLIADNENKIHKNEKENKK